MEVFQSPADVSLPYFRALISRKRLEPEVNYNNGCVFVFYLLTDSCLCATHVQDELLTRCVGLLIFCSCIEFNRFIAILLQILVVRFVTGLYITFSFSCFRLYPFPIFYSLFLRLPTEGFLNIII